MPETESFDAFYARTVWNVTSQMHALAGQDSAADHAIREAYARAYQQWYEVSGYRDPEGWVLSVARDGYQRRRPDGPITARAPSAGPADDDSGTWPGIYRPLPTRGPAAADPADRGPARQTFAPGPTWSAATASGAAAAAGAAGSDASGAGAAGQAGPSGRGLEGQSAGATTALASPVPVGPTGPARRIDLPGLSSRKALIAAAVAIVVVAAAAIGYVVASGGHKAPAAAGPHKPVTPAAKPKPHMLAAGRTGRRSAIPWSLIGAGWTLAEVSTATPSSTGGASAGGRYTTYLVDPRGGKYLVTTTTGAAVPQLVAWSGNGYNALYATVGAGHPSYGLLSLHTGLLTPLQLPANVNAVGFTRPDGLAILAVKQGPTMFKLQRYYLTGALQATIGELARKPGESWSADVCGTGCSALSSPDGDTDVWGIAGDEMQVLSNAGGHVRRLHVPDSGTPPSCVPISWWDSDTVLATCAATNGPTPGATRLWLVPTEGGAPKPLTVPSGGGSGAGDNVGAWTAGGTVYVNSTSFSQCSGAPSGPGGVAIFQASQAGSGSSPATIAGSTGNHNTIVAAVGDRLLVLAQTSCPGTSSLLWYRPATGATQPLLTESADQVGVVEAVPFGLGPEAVAAGI